MSMPLRIMIEKLGYASRSDAELYCRDIIQRYFSNPVECFFYIKQVDKQWYCEIQEGGVGKAYLPHLLKLLKDEEQPNEIFIPSATRYLKAVNDSETGIDFLLLNDDEAPEGVEVKTSNRMTPFQGDNRNYLIISCFALVTSMIVMVSSYISYKAIDTYDYSSQVDQFATLHRELNTMERLPEDRYMNKLQYQNGRWTSDIQRRDIVDNNKESIFITRANELYEELKGQGEE